MIDSDEINAIIASKVAETVAEQVANLFKNDTELVASLRSQAVSLLVRNFNLDALVKQGISEQVADKVAGIVVEDGTMIDSNLINTTVSNNITAATSEQIGLLLNTNPTLLGSLKTQAVTSLVRQVKAETDIDAMIANKISEQFADQFDGVAIHSDATKRELTIMDDTVVVESTLASTNVSVFDQLAAKNVSISGNLLITGTIDTSTGAWDGLESSIKLKVIDEVAGVFQQQMVDAVIAQVDELNFTQININGKPALTANTLGSQITDSTLNKVGTLKGLKVIGTSTLDAIHIEDKRVGINTTTPNSALDIWDSEVEIIAGKLKEQTAYVGTNKSQDLVLGVNRREDLKIDTDGVTTIQKLKLGDYSIKHSTTVPGYSGTPGDIVLNTRLTTANPIFAWYCLHDYSWVALKVTI